MFKNKLFAFGATAAVSLTGSALGFLWYMGCFKKVEVSKSTLAPQAFLYIDYQGPYNQDMGMILN